ncbi:MAG: hypothetical protein JW986_10375 [Methanotrichaceae archaeon]|nr:hypothetical protein [Methanotrichaceae archaeon]
MNYCRTCLLSNAHPFITFDSDNVCQYCRKPPTYLYKENEEFVDILTKIKSEKKDFNCLIGLSGGRDSSYLALRAIRDWGLRPLAYCYDNGHMPEKTKENVKKISEELGIKLIVIDNDVGRNRSLFKRILLAWIKKPNPGMIQTLCIGCRGGVSGWIPKLLKKYNIKYILDGTNNYENTSYKLGLFGINEYTFNAFKGRYKPLHLKLAFAISKEIFKNPYYINPSVLFYGASDFIKGFGANVERIHPFFYEKYNASEIVNAITSELDWQKPDYFPDSWRSDCNIALIKNFISYRLLGFSDYDLFFSNMIRDKAIDRPTAEERLRQINHNLDKSIPQISQILRSYGIDSGSIQSFFSLMP